LRIKKPDQGDGQAFPAIGREQHFTYYFSRVQFTAIGLLMQGKKSMAKIWASY